MPLAKLNIAPGFNADTTDYAVGAQWVRGNKVRFWQGKPEKLGGWAQKGSNEFNGTCRGMHTWASLKSVKYIALGTHTHLQLMAGNSFIDITPTDETGTLGNDPITTTLDSSVVSISDTAHARSINDRVLFSGATDTGGITAAQLNIEHTVMAVTDSDNYTISVSSTATSGATGGGASVLFTYYISVGLIDSFLGVGWGAGAWGDSTWGTPRETSDFLTPARTWSLDNFGEDLVVNPRGGEIYKWDTSVGTGTKAAILHASNSPLTNFIFVSPTDRHLVALGSDTDTSGTIDAMLVHWSDQEDLTLWASAATNTAGTFRLDNGSQLISGLNTRSISLIWSDTALYSMQFIGPPYTFGFELIGKQCGIMSPHSAIEIASRVYWWSRTDRNFYMFDGAVRQMPCPVLDGIRDDFNFDQQDKVHAVSNSQFNEVWWFYCTASSVEINSYVVYNFEENLWFTGTLERTSGVDRTLFNFPLLVDTTNKRVYEHENGVNDDGTAITSFVETGEIEATPGDRLVLMDKLVIDADITGSLDVTLFTRKYPTDAQVTKGPFAISSSDADGKLSFRAKGRQFAIRYGSDAIGDDWRLGIPRINTKVVGGR